MFFLSTLYAYALFSPLQAVVGQKLDNAIHQLTNLCPINNAIVFPNTYPLDNYIKELSWFAPSSFCPTGDLQTHKGQK